MNAPATTKQLKKIDLLNLMPTVPTTRAELVDLLSEYSYIPTYLDYLIDHFINQGKFIKNADGTLQKPLSKKAQVTAKQIFLVVLNASGNYELLSKANTGIVSKEDREAGWSVTSGAAIKKVTQAIFAHYKDSTTAVRALAGGEPTDVTGKAVDLDENGYTHIAEQEQA